MTKFSCGCRCERELFTPLLRNLKVHFTDEKGQEEGKNDASVKIPPHSNKGINRVEHVPIVMPHSNLNLQLCTSTARYECIQE